MSFKVEGTIYSLMETQQVKATFRKREFVLEYAENPTYPQYVKFESIQDRCEMLDDFQVGDKVVVEFNLKGREWVNRQGEKVYFNTLDAWRLTRAGAGGGTTSSGGDAAFSSGASAGASSNGTGEQPPLPNPEEFPSDDLPF